MNEKKFLSQVYNQLKASVWQSIKITDDSIELSDGNKIISKLTVKAVSFMQLTNNFQVSLTRFITK